MTDAPQTVNVVATQPVPASLNPHGYVLAVLIGLDVFINALFGGEVYQTMSCRIGESIDAGGWASHVPWPAWFRAHCAASIYTTVV